MCRLCALQKRSSSTTPERPGRRSSGMATCFPTSSTGESRSRNSRIARTERNYAGTNPPSWLARSRSSTTADCLGTTARRWSSSSLVRCLYVSLLPHEPTLTVSQVHTTGRFHFQTLLSILKYEHDLPLVHTSNRLDRLTSGVMICSLTVEGSKKLGAWFNGSRAAEGGVKKEYVARCRGRFPE